MTLLRLLRQHLRPYRPWIVAVVVFQTIQSSASLLLPSLNADIIDTGVVAGDVDYIWRTGGVMIAVTAGQIAFAIAAVYCAARTAMSACRDIRRDLFHRVTSFSAKEVNVFGSPSLITRITNDVQQVQMLIVMLLTMVVTVPATLIGGGILALRQDVGLSKLLAVTIPLMAIAMGIVVSRLMPQFRLMQKRLDNVSKVLREQISGMRVVRAVVREPQEVERFADVNDELTTTSLITGRLSAAMFPIMHIAMNASSVAVVWVGADRIEDGSLSIGSLVAFLTYFSLILVAVMMATFSTIMIPRAAVSAERIVEVLDTVTSVTVPEHPVRAVTAHGRIELRDVGFVYPGAEHPVLSNVSFASSPGETTAIIGSTGAGKTTLINLVARLFDVTSGAVLMDGVDIRELDPEILWSRIGLVPQRPYLFSGTVDSNLRFGKPDATDHEIWEALRIAQAEDFVRAAGGIDAPVNQGGTNLSGGQRQRLAIARALVRRPEVYLFDDSFSALDLATDARLRAALQPHTEDATVIVVAQRVSTIVHADRIVVLEDGVVVGIGTHQELLTTSSTYAEIVRSQIGAEEEVPA